jgi:hypothetical protein
MIRHRVLLFHSPRMPPPPPLSICLPYGLRLVRPLLLSDFNMSCCEALTSC